MSPNVEIRLATDAGSLKQAILDYRAAKTSNLAHHTRSHTATASFSLAFIQNSAGATLRNKNREYAVYKLSRQTDKITGI